MNSTLPYFQYLSQSAEDRFWAWFVENETCLFDCESDNKRAFAQLGSKLQQIDANLTFRFSDIDESSRREFVVSAGGIKRSFRAVETLASRAPAMSRWKVIAFRPRKGEKSVETNGMRLDASQVWFSHSYGDNRIGLNLHVDGFTATTRVTLINLALLLLEDMLGEYDMATKIGYVDIDRLPRDPAVLGYRPIVELPDVIDRLAAPLPM